jgi:hypothetical protein
VVIAFSAKREILINNKEIKTQYSNKICIKLCLIPNILLLYEGVFEDSREKVPQDVAEQFIILLALASILNFNKPFLLSVTHIYMIIIYSVSNKH